MSVPVPMEEVDEKPVVMGWMEAALTVAKSLTQIGTTQLGAAISYTEAVRTRLHHAAGLFSEDTDAAESLVNYVFALVPAGADQLLQTTADAASKLVASVLAGTPLLPGAITAAADLVASVFAIPPPIPGPLLDALCDIMLTNEAHDQIGHDFDVCAQDLGLAPGTETWQSWSDHRSYAIDQGREAEQRVNAVVWESMLAERALRRCLVESARRGEQILRDAISEVDAALVALLQMRDAVAVEEQIVRNAIDQVGYSP